MKQLLLITLLLLGACASYIDKSIPEADPKDTSTYCKGVNQWENPKYRCRYHRSTTGGHQGFDSNDRDNDNDGND